MEDGSTLSVADTRQMDKLSWCGTALDDPKVKKDAKVGGVLTDGDAIQVDWLLDRFSSWHSLKMFVA